jgi:hypothetical protein
MQIAAIDENIRNIKIVSAANDFLSFIFNIFEYDPAIFMYSGRIMMRPMDQSSLAVPDVITMRVNQGTNRNSLDAGRDIDVMFYQ